MMHSSVSRSHAWLAGVLSSVVVLAACSTQDAQKSRAPKAADSPVRTPTPAFTMRDGSLVRPEGYREWVFVGEPVTPNALNGGKAPFPEFHSVYIDPGSYAAYRETGEFPDGTILIKELSAVGATQAVSGKGFFMGDYIGLEATIKSAEHFPDEPGNWAYFSFTNPAGGPLSKTAEPFATKDCNACHQNSAAEDFVFTQYYPVLRAAKDEERAEPGAAPFSIVDGKLKRPVGYREWVFAGEPLTPNDRNGGKAAFPEFHDVYIDPDSYAHLRETGEFRDGTILIKELVEVGSTAAVSGNGYFMGDFIGLEATIKSAKHFPDEPGNWAYFSFTSEGGGPLKSDASPFPTASCAGCHEANAAQDLVFTQYYPVLRDAIGQAKGAPLRTDNQWQPTAPHPASVAGMPLEREALHAWLAEGSYKSFAAKESGTHPGRGPHTAPQRPVQVFYNDTLAASLKAGNAAHPKGAVAVKEMHDPGGALSGWAVMAKTAAESDTGKGWFWYEVTSTTDPGALPAAGNGVPGCIGCHTVGSADFVLSGWPLK